MSEQAAERPWLSAYPEGVPADIDPNEYKSLVELLDNSFRDFGPRVAFSFMGKDVTFAQIDKASTAMGAYLQSLGLVKGDRVAVMMPPLSEA